MKDRIIDMLLDDPYFISIVSIIIIGLNLILGINGSIFNLIVAFGCTYLATILVIKAVNRGNKDK